MNPESFTSDFKEKEIDSENKEGNRQENTGLVVDTRDMGVDSEPSRLNKGNRDDQAGEKENNQERKGSGSGKNRGSDRGRESRDRESKRKTGRKPESIEKESQKEEKEENNEEKEERSKEEKENKDISREDRNTERHKEVNNKEVSDKEVSNKEVSDKEVSGKEVSDKEVSNKEGSNVKEENRKERQRTLVDFETLSGKKSANQAEVSGIMLSGTELEAEPLRVVVDHREMKSGVAKVLDRLGVDSQFCNS